MHKGYYSYIDGVTHFWASSTTLDAASIQTIPIVDVIDRAEQDSSFASLCDSPDLATFWEEKMLDLFKGSFHPKKIENPSPFKQYRAQYYYNLAVINDELKSGLDNNIANLMKATQYGSYLAASHIIKHSALDVFQKLELLQYVQPKHTSLTYISVYYVLLNHVLQRMQSEDENKAEVLLSFLEQAYIAIYIAEFLLEQSEDAVFNASFGLGIQHLFPDLQSFDKAKNTVFTLINSMTSLYKTENKNFLVDLASKEFKKVQNEILNSQTLVPAMHRASMP